jgi:hypothetical protein
MTLRPARKAFRAAAGSGEPIRRGRSEFVGHNRCEPRPRAFLSLLQAGSWGDGMERKSKVRWDGYGMALFVALAAAGLIWGLFEIAVDYGLIARAASR